MAPLADFGGYWFVCTRLMLLADDRPPTNHPLPAGLDRERFTEELCRDVTQAAMRVWPNVVDIDVPTLTAACATAETVFEARDGLLAAAVVKDKAKDARDGFADYVVTRWIWKLVLKHDVRRRPIKSPFPANYDAKRKRELVDALEQTLTRHGMTLDVAEVRKGVDKWKDLGDVRTAVLANTK